MAEKINYYFIGIGGIGMSGLAKILKEQGFTVNGSDVSENKQTKDLEKLGIRINFSQISKNISKNIENVVVTSAIKPDNPELEETRNLGLNIISRSELLNTIITRQKAIAVTGTHGKTTTSSMIALILEKAGLDPTAIIGAEINMFSSNAKLGHKEYSVAEVCEYKRAFLDIYPHIAVVTNIEEDHLDCYKDLKDIISAFKMFTANIDKNGFLIVCGDDKSALEATSGYSGENITYGFGETNDWRAIDIETKEGTSSFTVGHKNDFVGKFVLIVPGFHNILNALASIVLAKKIGIENKAIFEVLKDFTGADRRFQIKGMINKILIIDDYAHHPTEVMATLSGARQFYPNKRIITVFQPHQHSRTKFLLEDFGKAFSDADLVIMPEIYAVRDTAEDIKSVSSQDVVNLINTNSPNKAKFFKSFDETQEYLKEIAKKDDVIITIGAGPVFKIGETLLKTLK